MKHKNLKKVPNYLTVLRLLLVPIIIALSYTTNKYYLSAALILFVVATFTDWADGFLARRYNLITTFGTFFDPMVDKILILGIYFLFVDLGLLPLWMVLLLLFREFFVSGIRQVCSEKKMIVGANWMGKSKFTMQVIIILFVQLHLIVNSAGYAIPFGEQIIYYAALIMTLISLGYAINFMLWNRKVLFKDL
jgi:CDP-diacylglycerol---glycerol-3-phosphate 3-phosphatidyltransferase